MKTIQQVLTLVALTFALNLTASAQLSAGGGIAGKTQEIIHACSASASIGQRFEGKFSILQSCLKSHASEVSLSYDQHLDSGMMISGSGKASDVIVTSYRVVATIATEVEWTYSGGVDFTEVEWTYDGGADELKLERVAAAKKK